MHYNIMGQPALWERFFSATKCDNLGLEWDPSHLLCQFIDPVANLRRFGARVFHAHAKDAFIDRSLLETYGPCHPGVAEHRFPGLGQADWPEIIRALPGLPRPRRRPQAGRNRAALGPELPRTVPRRHRAVRVICS